MNHLAFVPIIVLLVGMTVQEFCQRICFSRVQPETEWPRDYRMVVRGLDHEIEAENTVLPETNPRLRELDHIPRMSSYAIGAIINHIAGTLTGGVFLNIGVWHGYTMLSGIIGNPNLTAIGVDNFSEFGNPRESFLAEFNKHKSDAHRFYDMDFREYFKAHKGIIGFYIYDGPHEYGDQLDGLRLAEPFFSDRCIILVDDTNLPQVRKAVEVFMAGSKFRYDIPFDRTTRGNYHPTFWNGIMVLQRQPGL